MSHPASSWSSPRTRSGMTAADPALAELRALPLDQLTAQLTQLLPRWLAPPRPAREFPLRVESARSRTVTLALSLGDAVLPLPVACRFHQRCTALPVQQVDAFAGYLVRANVPLGLLITTGEVTAAARRAASAAQHPRIQLYSGPEWLAALAQRRVRWPGRCGWPRTPWRAARISHSGPARRKGSR